MKAKNGKNILLIKILELNQGALAVSIGSTAKEVTKTFQDGRIASRFTEFWIGKLFDVEIYPSAVNPKSDGTFKVFDKSGQKFELSCKCLTKNGIKFQDSKYVGIDRKCTPKNLWDSIMSTDRLCVADIRVDKYISMFIFDSKIALSWVKDGKLTPSGLSAKKFYKLINKEFDEIKYELYKIETGEDMNKVFKEDFIPKIEYIKQDEAYKIKELECLKKEENERAAQQQLL